MDMSIAERIRLVRKQKGWSQAKLAELVGVCKSACSQWEQGVTTPSVENLSRLAIVLDVYFEWLATGRGEMVYPNSSRNPEADR